MADDIKQYPGTWAEKEPDRPAVIMAADGRIVTYRELDDTANRLARVFHSIGLKPGDHVAFCMENRAEYLPIMWGCHYAGLYYTAVSSRLTADELAYILEDSGSRVFITSPYKADQVAELGDRLDRLDLRLSVGGAVAGFDSFEEAIAAQSPEPLPDRVEGGPMLYSSGTTGRPKGVKAALPDMPLGTPDGLSSLITLLFGATEASVYLSPAPLYHAAPLRYCAGFHRIGATVLVMERFDAEGALDVIARHRVTHSQWVPTMFVRMLKLPEATRGKYDLSSLSCAVHAAAPCPVPVKEQMIKWWGPVLHEYYAGTEGNGFVYCNSEAWLAHKGTVGQPLGSEVHIIGEDGVEVPVGQEGAVYFGESTVGGRFEYHNDPEKTSKSYMDNGWSTLGDIGRLDEDNFLYLTDRKANMIISGGVNIYPQETENVLTMHPKVQDVAVFGVPNEDFGEEVKAVVQPAEMSDAGPEFESELIAYCRENLADVKCPRSVDFREELPRHPTGKLYKRLLKDEYWKGHQSRIV
ncbi:MAG: acyl-CoA synthetase [Candidatus Binatia bacterium]|nr:acyl-CoA synthetase [Candidatus Binatia bacterium]